MAMFEISGQKARELIQKAEGWKNKIDKIKEQNEERAGMVLGAGLIVGMAFVGAYANGRYSDLGSDGKPTKDDKFSIASLPADLLLGTGTLIGGIVGAFGRYDHLATSAGSGLVAGNLAISAYRMGRQAKATDEGVAIAETFNPKDETGVLPGFSSTGDAGMLAGLRAARAGY